MKQEAEIKYEDFANVLDARVEQELEAVRLNDYECDQCE